MMQILGKTRINNVSIILKRYKSRKEHWSVLQKKIKPRHKALAHFDDFYGSVYGDTWQHVRAAMLKEENKHVAVVNNFTDRDAICEELSLLGAIDLSALYEVYKRSYEERIMCRKTRSITEGSNYKSADDTIQQMNQPMTNILQSKRKSDIQSILPAHYDVPEEVIDGKEDGDDLDEDGLPKPKTMDSIELRSLGQDLKNANFDESRIIKPSIGLTSDGIHEYMPATKLKGLDDYILESDHFGHYSKGADFSVPIEYEAILNFPQRLKIYTFEGGNNSRFPSARRRPDGVYDYYLMDGASILPVLALDLQVGDTILDMCAAPGGKSLAALQTLTSRMLVGNDISLSRLNHMNRILQDYLGDFDAWQDKLFLTNVDARIIADQHIYNKILVDAPCTTDRHNLHVDDNNIFSPKRVKERLLLPELQTEILLQALKIVAPGGTVVYSTCSLSPIQNDGVVQMAMKRCWEETKSLIVVKNMDEALGPLRNNYKFASDCGLRYGHLVLPTKNNNCGPLYFSKIVKLP